jgi:membrane protein implicated in regulation of membrane protease activity
MNIMSKAFFFIDLALTAFAILALIVLYIKYRFMKRGADKVF